MLFSKDKFLISLLCFRQETLFLVSLATFLWMGERCVTSKNGYEPETTLTTLFPDPDLFYFAQEIKRF